MSLDLERHLTFYGAYHHNPVNVAIHMFCVPLILFSGFALATNTGALVPVPSWLTVPYLDLNLGTLAALTWGALYVLLEPVAGTTLAIIGLATTALCNSFRLDNATATNQVALATHVVCWILQFIGHGAFEKRAPALVDNLLQAVFLAPLFVWLELLFMLGYRPELKARVDKAAEEEITKFKAAKSEKDVKNGKAQ